MSTRHVPPHTVKRWPFYLGDAILLAVAWGALAADGSPPAAGTLILVAACVLVGVGLFVVPHLMEYDARVRLAEAGISDQLEAQARRLTQAAEQLSHAVSRSQSTEEQVGQALGALEDLSEKLSGQSEELAQMLARSGEREVTELRAEIDRLAAEREKLFSALNSRIEAVGAALQEVHSTAKLSLSSQAKAHGEVHARLDATGARIEEILKLIQHVRAAPPSASGTGQKSAPIGESTDRPARKDKHAPPTSAENPTSPQPPEGEPGSSAAMADSKPAAEPKEPAPPTNKQQAEHGEKTSPGAGSSKRGNKPADATGELPVDSAPAPKPASKGAHREPAGATSIVATAYIGIGNKLFLRGEGPGLSWEEGVPMQFLAIGKWGWTTTDAREPVTCRIFRNDEAPMLDADVVIGPGEKAEITPRF